MNPLEEKPKPILKGQKRRELRSSDRLPENRADALEAFDKLLDKVSKPEGKPKA